MCLSDLLKLQPMLSFVLLQNDFLGQNPLLLLARTCQNIGMETKSAPSPSASSSSSKSTTNGTISIKPSNPFSVSNSLNKAPPNRTATKATTSMIPPVQSFPPVNGVTSHSPKCTQSSVPPQSNSSVAPSHITEESELYIPPSSNSLIQLARLSSSLKLPSSTANERQKRSAKPIDTPKFPLALTGSGGVTSRPQKRARRQSFGRTASSSLSGPTKPLDFSSHFSSHSSPLSISSSVSPSSLRSTPPSHTTPPPAPPPAPANPSLFDFMKNLTGLSVPTDSLSTTNTATPPNNLETLFNVGSLLGTSPENLHELLVSIAHSLSERRLAESNFVLEQQQKQQQSKVLHGAISDPSTQCLYCGHVCSDMGSLVQHIYTHLASLHKQQTETPPLPQAVPPPPPPPPPPAPIVAPPSTSPFDLVAFYAKLLQKTPESLPSAPPPMVSTDPNALFLAWLNVFRPAYAEGLAGSANR
ncbi:unnamed protein product [Hydatigera taeniaeformis]|uniref:C2H2-type domain-containing protein n=1 Tax=Hydatigena taeniaeformis TaxID=6205 RepID=A0A0R3X988_HYDTA|nr:unnamed protein product [Hydatigera taeniaeformis]